MGRWIVLEEDDFVRDNSDGWCGSCASEDDAKNIARRHKQECDHYEQRIAELEAEIARIKAESLRVVPTEKHELGHYEVAMAVILNHAATIYEHYDSEDGELVRLKRWETEDGN